MPVLVSRDGEADTVPGCAAHTGMPKEHHCSEVRGWTHHDLQGHTVLFAALLGATVPGHGYP